MTTRTTRMTDAEARQRAVSSLGLGGFHPPQPTGQEDTDQRLKVQYEKKVQGRIASLRATEATTIQHEQEANQRLTASRAAAADEEKANIRRQFLAGNPTASEGDFERLWPSLRDAAMLERSNQAMAQAKASGRYAM